MANPVPEGWVTIDGATEYSPDHFYTHTTDKRGHYERINCRLEPWLLAWVGEIVATVDDYRSNSDFVRDALFHRAHYIKDHIEEMNETVSARIARMQGEIERQQQLLEHTRNAMQGLDDLMRQAVASRNMTAIANAIELVEEAQNTFERPFTVQCEDLIRQGETALRSLRPLYPI